MNILHRIGNKPVIAALRDPGNIERVIASQVDHIFFMGGSVIEIIKAIQLAKQSGRGSFVHLDLIKGLSNADKESVEFVAEYVGAEGIITPKSHLIKEAKKYGLFGILHLFVIDSLALTNGLKLVETVMPDAVEIMPGIMNKIISKFVELNDHIPVISSGLIETQDEVSQCLQAGATCVSVSKQSLWTLTFKDI